MIKWRFLSTALSHGNNRLTVEILLPTFLYPCGLMMACSCPPQETTEKDGQAGHTPHSTSTYHPPKHQLEAELYTRLLESGCSRYRQHKKLAKKGQYNFQLLLTSLFSHKYKNTLHIYLIKKYHNSQQHKLNSL